MVILTVNLCIQLETLNLTGRQVTGSSHLNITRDDNSTLNYLFNMNLIYFLLNHARDTRWVGVRLVFLFPQIKLADCLKVQIEEGVFICKKKNYWYNINQSYGVHMCVL